MNQRCFRLVFSRSRGMLVPVGEHAAALCGRRRTRAVAAVAGLLAATLAWGDVTVPAGTLPIPVIPIDSANIAATGAATAAIDAATRTMTVDQASLRAVIDWQQFNLGTGATLQFNHQLGAASATLNRIHDANPSVIQGAIRAAGEVYLFNQNGILFKDGAQVDVGSLVASSLRIRDEAFERGFLSLPIGAAAQAAFEWGGTLAEFQTSLVEVEPGAALNASTGGRVMLLAPTVVNGGHVSAPEGQVIMAGGAKVFLTAPLDATLRGFLVEVDPYQAFDGGGQPIDVNGGTVTNALSGRVLADRGNATLAGFAVNQNGRVSATTSVNLNGSVFLQARDQVSLSRGISTVIVNGNVVIPRGQRTGTVTFGPGSLTEVMPQRSDATTTQDAQGFVSSLIDVVGRRVNLEAGSLIRAPGGNVNVSAQTAALFQVPGTPAVGDVRIYAAPGARIDVSGTQGVELSVARNFLEVELRGNELRDAPLQRDSFLRGQKVTIDIRKGTPVADVSGFINQVGRTVSERTTAGGNITLRSEGDVVLLSGSALDVSGGSLRFTEARVAETQLRGADGRIYAMSEASPDLLYVGFADRSPEQDPVAGRATGILAGNAAQKPMEAGYTEGRSAGSITVVSHVTVLDGDLAGRSTAGEWQRGQATAPLGGALILGDISADAVAAGDGKLRDLAFVANPERLPVSFASDGVLEAPWNGRTQLDPVALFTRGGFTRVSANANGLVSVAADAPLRLAPWASLSLAGRSIQIAGDITAPGGAVSLTTTAVIGEPVTDRSRFLLAVSDGVRIDTAGLWTNDLASLNPRRPTSPLAQDGGRIELRSVGDVVLGAGSLVDVSAGARVDAVGALTAGDAGTLSVESGRIGIGDADRQVSSLTLGGELRGFGIAQPRLGERGLGGTLRLSTSSVVIGPRGIGDTGQLVLDAGFFDRGGFTAFQINGQDSLEVMGGVGVAPAAMARLVDGTRVASRRTGTPLAEVGTLWQPAGADRPATHLRLDAGSAVFGHVLVQPGAALAVNAGGSITIESGRRVTVLGALDAPAGAISVRNTPPGSNDSFEGDVSVWIGATARLFAQGRAVTQRDPLGRHLGDVLDGGRVELEAAKGSLVIAAGAQLDVSGVVAGRATLTAGGTTRIEDRLDLPILSPLGIVTYRDNAAVASNAGEIVLAAREGMFVDGALAAHAGRAANGMVAGTAGGSLRVVMQAPPQLTFPGTTKNIVVSGSTGLGGAPTFLPTDVGPGDLIPVQVGGVDVQGNAYLGAGPLSAAGFDVIDLSARDRLVLDGDAVLQVGRALRLVAPQINVAGAGTALLQAASVQLGNPDPLFQSEVVPEVGTGELQVRARVLDLVGRFALGGVDRLRLESSSLPAQGMQAALSGGDVRLQGVVVDTDPSDGVSNRLVGGMTTAASRVDIVAERVLPTTASSYSLRSIDAGNGLTGGVIAFSYPGSPGPEQVTLSAAGTLTVQARDILQDGRLVAPFGTIRLEATDSLVLGPGSVTSVSGEGLTIPFGRTELSGKDWVYALGSGFGNQVFDGLPEKRIDLSSPDVRLLSGVIGGQERRALVALGGGGDLLAREFVPGPGGSRDILDPLVSSGSFAVLPVVASAHGPIDHQAMIGLSGWSVGDQIELTGVKGLPDGRYTLLPPAYAALPGAFLVTPQAGPRDLPAGVFAPRYTGPVTGSLADVQVVAANRAARSFDGAVVRDERTSLFVVEPGAAVALRAEYRQAAASTFFSSADGASVPGDAGRLALSTTGTLLLDGLISGAAQAGRRGMQVDIAAPVIRVRSSVDAPAVGNGLDLEVSRLNALGAASLLLGGTRSRVGDQVTIAAAGAGSVVLANRADDPLLAGEVMLVSPGDITLGPGAAVVASGTGVDTVRDIMLEGSGAFVRVANGPVARVDRSAFDAASGRLSLESGSRLEAAGSIALDATRSTSVDSGVALTAPAISLAAGRIDLGEAAPVSQDGLVLGADLLDGLGRAESLTLRSYTGIDLYGASTVGSLDGLGLPTLSTLILDAPSIAARGAGDRTFRAATVVVRNSGGVASGADGVGGGALRLEARTDGAGAGGTLLIGPGEVRVTGVDTFALQGDRELRFAGAAGLQTRTGLLEITTPVLSGDSAAALTLANQTGLVALLAPAADPGGQAAGGLGATLEVSGHRVDLGTRILLPSGDVSATALGTAAEDAVRVLTGGAVDVAGVPVLFTPGVVRSGPGGRVALASTVGDVVVGEGARVDVSGALDDTPGGRLVMRAGRALLIDGDLAGAGAAAIEVDVGAQADAGAFAAIVAAGGFGGGVSWRQRTGDISIAAGQSIASSNIALAADAGGIEVAGSLDASGVSGGRIELWATQDIRLVSGASVLASATEPTGRAGRVLLGTRDGELRLETASTVDLSGAGDPGQLWLRAPRDGNDVAIGALDATLAGVGEVVIEAVRVYNAGTLGVAAGADLSVANTGGSAILFNDTTAYSAAARPAIISRLGKVDGPALSVRPGIEVRGDVVTLSSDWNFFCGAATTCSATEGLWSPGAEPGVLTLRATGALALNGTLNDGFRALPPANLVTASVVQMNDAFVPRSGAGWSYRLIAGADAASANPLATVAGVEADLTLASGKMVRTSDGSIDVAVARDIVFGDVRSVMYTAGEPGPAVAGFVVPNPPAVSGQPRPHTPTYTEGGGDVRLVAGRDLLGVSSGRSVTEWLYRDVRRTPRGEIQPNPQTTWWVRFDAFQEGVGALGGGDVVLSAGRDVVNVSAAVPTNARLGGELTVAPSADNFLQLGGGDLEVDAGRDILGGVYLVQRGTGDIRAGRDLAAGVTVGEEPLHTQFALGDAAMSVRAGRSAIVEGVFNPTIQRQPRGNLGNTGLLTSYFLTYTPISSFDLVTLTGDARLSNNRELLPQLPGSPMASFGSAGEAASSVIYPGTVRVAALSANVTADREFFLAPAAEGQLELLAQENVSVGGRILMSDVSVRSLPAVLRPSRVYSDAIEPLIVQAAEQGAIFHDEAILHAGDRVSVKLVAARGDIRGPVDDVSGISPLGVFPKSMILVAGRDVLDTWIIGQNTGSLDVTRIEAGRDLRFNTLRDALGNQRTNLGGIQWGGPGEVQVSTGRDVDLGNSLGIVTVGNLDNPFLPEAGADIRVSTGGLAPDYQSFLDVHLDTDVDRLALRFPWVVRQRAYESTGIPEPDTPEGLQRALSVLRGLGEPEVAAFVESVSYRTELISYMRNRSGEATLDADVAVERFLALDRPAQTEFVNAILFEEIRLAGNPVVGDAVPLPGADVRGYRALSALYPVEPEVQSALTESNFAALVQLIGERYGKNVKPLLAEMRAAGDPPDPADGARAFARNALALSERYSGDVSLFFSQIKTQQGGDIELRVPGGLINAGLANPGRITKGASDLGIVTVRGGSVQATVLEDFLVNQSRVFTLGGGDIRLWSSFGNIDAGKGAKTASATPPPQIVIRNGKFVLDTSRSVEGSGIGVLLSRSDVPPGNSELITPLGEVDAGDAGIRVAGNLIVRAQTVANATNVNVGGSSSGVPASTATLSVGVTGASSVDSQTSQAVAKAAESAASGAAAAPVARMPSFITVEVLGIGEEGR